MTASTATTTTTRQRSCFAFNWFLIDWMAWFFKWSSILNALRSILSSLFTISMDGNFPLTWERTSQQWDERKKKLWIDRKKIQRNFNWYWPTLLKLCDELIIFGFIFRGHQYQIDHNMDGQKKIFFKFCKWLGVYFYRRWLWICQPFHRKRNFTRINKLASHDCQRPDEILRRKSKKPFKKKMNSNQSQRTISMNKYGRLEYSCANSCNEW